MEEVVAPPLTPAERHYLSLKKAQAAYHRRKNPNPRPVGRPPKIPKTDPSLAGVAEPPLVEKVV
jgi:hypothetical protein